MIMEYSIIGTGNMAWFMAERLHAAGWHCTGIYGRNRSAATELAAICAAAVYTDLSRIPDRDHHICILAVSDNAIAEIAAQLHFSYNLLIHTSGTSAIELLQDAAAQAAVLWPVSPVMRGAYTGQIPFLWEATDAESAVTIRSLAAILGGDPVVEANGTQRRYLHLSAVFTNNFVNHMVAVGEALCAEQSLSFDLLRPLLRNTYERILKQPAKILQTGPARRGDGATMSAHEELLLGHQEWLKMYQAVSASITDMYRQ